MNKLLAAIFDNEAAADADLNALRTLHAAGDITVYATGVLARDAKGVVSVKKSMDAGPTGTVTGLAVGSLIGLLGGQVFRRARSEVAEAQFDHDIVAFRAEIKELDSEASHASGGARLAQAWNLTREALTA
jgi:hypothetical protein